MQLSDDLDLMIVIKLLITVLYIKSHISSNKLLHAKPTR